MAAVVQVLLGLLLAACVLSSPKYSAPPNNQEDINSRQERQKPCDGMSYEDEKFHVKDEVILDILEKAAFGIDPFKLNSIDNLDPGVKQAIFKPIYTSNISNVVIMNDFMNVPRKDVRCQTKLETKFLHFDNNVSFDTYQKSQIPSIDITPLIELYDRFNISHRVHPNQDYINGTNEHVDKVYQLQRRADVEVFTKIKSCLTHTTSINSNIKPVFTDEFLQSLPAINDAARIPESESSRKVFQNFVLKFGSHYQSSTSFGSATIYEKLYSTKSKGEEEIRKRRRCASLEMNSEVGKCSVSYDSSSSCSPLINELNKCDSLDNNLGIFENLNIPSSRIISLGPTELNTNLLSREIKIFPTAIHYHLKPIASLFKEDWFESFSNVTSGPFCETLNSTAMYDFFQDTMKHYCDIILGAPCEVATKGCGYSDSCPNNTECVEDSSEAGYHCTLRGLSTPSPAVVENTESDVTRHNPRIKTCEYPSRCGGGLICVESNEGEQDCVRPCDVENICDVDHNCYEEPHSCKGYICVYSGPGEALIVGGWRKLKDYLPEVESLPPRWSPSQLPRSVSSTTLVATSDYFYSCGGYDEGGSATANCFRLHRHETDASWQLAKPLPRDTYIHTSVLMGNNNIWHVVNNEIHNFDITTGEYATTTLPFRANKHRPCAVSNGNYSYVIGVGDNDDEIWVNTKAQNEMSWQKSGNMKQIRNEHACTWYDSNIIITGGGEGRSDVEIFNTETNTIREVTPMLTGRTGHAMMLYDGYPTVVGGKDYNNFLDDLESYDIGTGQWFTQDIKLEKAKAFLGLAEIEPHLGVRGDGQC